MKLPARFNNLGKQEKNALQEFQDDNPDLFTGLSPDVKAAYLKICGSVSHWRSRKAWSFFLNMFRQISAFEDHPEKALVLDGGISLSRVHWALVQHYFSAVGSLPADRGLLTRYIETAHNVWGLDIDVAVGFMSQTPAAVEVFGAERLFLWVGQAMDACKSGQRISRANRAYLEEAVALEGDGVVELSSWSFFLEQAVRISELSPAAGEAFIRQGVRLCLLLGQEDTIKWVSDGLEGFCLEAYVEPRNFRRKVTQDQMVCSGEEDLVKYFSGISSKALEKRDGLVPGVTLKDKSNTLALICEAFLGRRAKIASNRSILTVKGFTGSAATDGRTIYLPDTVPEFGLYKLMALHQTMLLDSDIWADMARRKVPDPVRMHLEGDQRLLKRLPGLRAEMAQSLEGGLPDTYPHMDPAGGMRPMPWWGDILLELIRETEETIAKLKEKAASHAELHQEVVDGIVTSMMAEGNREEDSLWRMLKEMFDQIEFVSPDAEELQESVKTFFYKEWDDNLSDYKLDWCLVRQRFAKDEPNDFAEEIKERLHGIISLVRRQFTRLKPERFRKFRAQPYGDALDIDALVQAVVDKRSGGPLSENVYVRRDKRIRDVAVLFLVDLSASTEEKVNGRRVIDIQKEAMVLMAEALDALDDPYAIYGFSSDGRFRVDMFSVKDFAEPYSSSVQYRLGNLKPLGLTRMGAVIRHATHKLESVSAAVRLMVILTDGRPYDYEYGNLDYAILDTKKAIQEARRQRIHPFIITSDKKGSEYLRQVAPQTQSIILSKVELLPTMLPAIYKRLTV